MDPFSFLENPKLDDDVVDQLKSKGKDPHFGQERVLFKLQETLFQPWMQEEVKGYHLEFSNPSFQASPAHTVASD